MESVYWVSGILVSTTPLAGHGKCFSDILSDTNVPKGSDTGGGTPIWNRRGCSSEILNLTPKGDHLGEA